MTFAGATPIIDRSGDLVLPLKNKDGQSDVRFQKPILYQLADGVRKPVSGKFAIARNREVRFQVSSYDHNRELVIDPMLLYSSYIGGSGAISGVTSSPAKVGETIVIYGVGFGPVTPNIPAGEIATESSQLSAPLTMHFGKTPADLTYLGLSPDSVGVYQFNVEVPAEGTSDLVPLTFTLGGVAGTQTLYTALEQ
jgi:hypothetical protein